MKTLIFLFSLAFASSGIQTESVNFTLLNKTSKSIPLKIPGVMNPNLSPFSNSGVQLKIGQKIYFTLNDRKAGKKELLLIVTKDLEGQKLVVNDLIKKRKKELKRKKNQKRK